MFRYFAQSVALTAARRRGLTLVELMVVILIVMMISAVALPILSPQLGARQQREAARSLSAFIAGAQARAKETGRPAGIWIERFPNGEQWSINVFYAETPPPFTGAVPGEKIELTNAGSGVIQVTAFSYSGPPDGMIRNGDILELEGLPGGYRINPDAVQQGEPAGALNWNLSSLSSLSTAPSLTDIVPTGSPKTFSYRIIRQPRKVNAGALTLPAGTAIDLNFSGDDQYPWFPRLGNPAVDPTHVDYTPYAGDQLAPSDFDVAGCNKPVVLMFNSKGVPETVYCPVLYVTGGTGSWRWSPIPMYTPIYMLVGKIEKVPPEMDEYDEHNWTDPENMWVAVHPQTGRVTTAEVGFVDDSTVSTLSSPVVSNGLRISRQYVAQGLAVGGR